MRIKLAILERDTSYLNRIVSVFSTKYAENFEIYSFTSQEMAMATLDESKIDVLLSDDSFEIDPQLLPRRCALAYLVESSDIDAINDQWAIFKYQKIELIYKQILSLYAEKASSVSGLKMDEGTCKTIFFGSASGGTGSSCMAAACALFFTRQAKRVMYLNLEMFGSSAIFFSGPGQFDMSDVVFTIKSKKSNLALKIESFVRKDARGVFYFAPSKIALDMLEMTADDMITLINEIKLTGSYDYIIIDGDFALTKDALKVFRQAHALVLVGDGSEISNEKTARAFLALSTLEHNSDSPISYRTKLLYNKFSNKTSKAIGDIGIPNLGGAPRFERATAADVVQQLSSMDLFGRII